MAATVGMMAKWDLLSLKRDMEKLRVPLVLVATDRDRTVSPRVAEDTKAIVPRATIVRVKGYGHLAHEEAPAVFSDIILDRALAPC